MTVTSQSALNGQQPGGTIGAQLLRWLEAGGCPACRAGSEAAVQAEFGFLYENVNDPDLRQRIVEAYGFCPLHTWQTYRCAGSRIHSFLGVALVYHELAGLLLADVASPRPGQTRLAGRLHPCYICSLAAPAEPSVLKHLPAHLRQPSFRDSYVKSDGLCLFHVGMALPFARSAERALLVDCCLRQGPRWQSLAGLAPDVALPIDVRETASCSVCAAVRPHLEAVLTDPDPGLCRLHAHWLSEPDPWAGRSWQSATDWLRQASARAAGLRLPWGRPAGPPRPCAACLAVERAEAALPPEAWQDAGCFPHLRAAARAGRPLNTDVLRPRLEQLVYQLGEFCRKHDYRYTREPWGDEQYSLPKALALFAGSLQLPPSS